MPDKSPSEGDGAPTEPPQPHPGDVAENASHPGDAPAPQPSVSGRRWLPQWRPRNVGRLFRSAVRSFRPVRIHDTHAMVRLQSAERRGLQLAILCRTIGFGIAGTYYIVSLLFSNSSPTFTGVGILITLTMIGVAHFIVIGTRYDRHWLKFVMVTIDIGAICALTAFVPLSYGDTVPQIFVYSIFNVHMLVPFIALSALSLSPALVLWAGASAVIGWWAAFGMIVAPMETVISWSALPPQATLEEYLAVIHSPNFIARGTRMVETISLAIVSGVLALAVARGRAMFLSQVRAEEGREAERASRARVTRQLGRFVPAAIAKRLIGDPAGIRPQVRHGAVLVMDIADFTAYAEGRGPSNVIAELNTFLADCADHVGAEEGVVISFTGDGLLATFNTPLEVDAPEVAALRVAHALLECGKTYGFAVRVGVAAGSVAAGSVGSSQRQAFTVYGDTVNRAARLEALAKEPNVAILCDEEVSRAVPEMLTPAGAFPLRGFSEPVAVFIASAEERTAA
ncbi:MAG: adenylate/guanylate cyclase domain-containing protein [Pseudomonadota bacterium]